MMVTAPADPELLLAAACCRWPPSPARDQTVRAAAEAIDWPRFGRVVKRQRIAGLVDGALRSAAIQPPPAVAISIGQEATRIVHANLLATAETARLTRLIADAGYPVLAVKGVVLGALAYGSIALKHSKDVDLLVLPQHSGAVMALLEADSYRLTHPAETLSGAQREVLAHYGKDVSLKHRARPVQVELHWRLFANTTLLAGITAASSTQMITIAPGLTVPTLAAPDLYAYLVLHGAIDGWSRMKWIADVNALLAVQDASAIAALHAHAVALGAGAASAQALLLMADLFGLPLPSALEASFRASRRVRMLVAGAYRLMAVPDGATEIGDWWGGQMLSLGMQTLHGGGVRSQWQIARSVLYMQPDMYRSKITPALYGLYPVIRVPLWIGRRLAGLVNLRADRGKSATIGTESR